MATLASSCVVMGNGPSAAYFHWYKTKLPFYVCNLYPVYPLAGIEVINSLVLADPAATRIDEEVSEVIFKFANKENRIKRINVLEVFVSTEWKARLKPKHWVLEVLKSQPDYGILQLSPEGFMIDSNEHTIFPMVQTTPQLSILKAIHDGYKTIFLFGCETNPLLHVISNEKGNFLGEWSHYYQRVSARACPQIDIVSQLQSDLRAFLGYRKIAEFAKLHGVTIYNMAADSWIDCFPKLSPNKLIDAGFIAKIND